MKRIKNLFKFLLILGLFTFFGQLNPMAQTGGEFCLYGTVTTVDGESYTGQLRWGKEEATWQDLFNSQKIDNPYLKYLDREDIKENERRENKESSNWNFRSLFEDYNYNSWSPSKSHSFACLFGDIASMRITGRNEVELLLKNGEEIELRGGSNDVGTKITVYDDEIGKMEMEWARIDRVEFKKAPKNFESQMGEPLYGIVKTRDGSWEGYIQWDEDETLGEDRLDGDSRNGDLSIEFANIKSIKRGGRGSDVVLKSGRELYLTGSNDVNSGNRGIIIKNADWGRVKIEWREFESVEFTSGTTGGLNYEGFPSPKRLKGSVTMTNGEAFTGYIVYDLDEAWDMEMLDGENEGLDYKIPFRVIKSIEPKNFEYSTVTLRNGEKLLLGDSNDVSDRNDGIFVFKKEKDKDPVYLNWKEVKQVTFE